MYSTMSKDNNSSAADAEAASSSAKNEILRGLNEDLAREYKQLSSMSYLVLR
jgi:uncharacterized protein (DUF1800 family)